MIAFTNTAPPPFPRSYSVIKAEQEKARRLARLLRHIGDELVADQLERMRLAEGQELAQDDAPAHAPFYASRDAASSFPELGMEVVHE